MIIRHNFGTPLIDGFCQHANDKVPALIFINSQQPKDRFRFSLAHEIAHLVMHQTPYPQQEAEANQFAAAFLMPASEIAHDFDLVSIRRLQELKSYWGVSMQALVYRAWQLGKMDDRQYKYFQIEMSKRGWRKSEPLEPTHLREEPTTLRDMVRAHINDLGYSLEELGDLFGLEKRDLLTLYPIEQDRPKLRLVSNRN